jgi:hypothetical protein
MPKIVGIDITTKADKIKKANLKKQQNLYNIKRDTYIQNLNAIKKKYGWTNDDLKRVGLWNSDVLDPYLAWQRRGQLQFSGDAPIAGGADAILITNLIGEAAANPPPAPNPNAENTVGQSGEVAADALTALPENAQPDANSSRIISNVSTSDNIRTTPNTSSGLMLDNNQPVMSLEPNPSARSRSSSEDNSVSRISKELTTSQKKKLWLSIFGTDMETPSRKIKSVKDYFNDYLKTNIPPANWETDRGYQIRLRNGFLYSPAGIEWTNTSNENTKNRVKEIKDQLDKPTSSSSSSSPSENNSSREEKKQPTADDDISRVNASDISDAFKNASGSIYAFARQYARQNISVDAVQDAAKFIIENATTEEENRLKQERYLSKGQLQLAVEAWRRKTIEKLRKELNDQEEIAKNSSSSSSSPSENNSSSSSDTPSRFDQEAALKLASVNLSNYTTESIIQSDFPADIDTKITEITNKIIDDATAEEFNIIKNGTYQTKKQLDLAIDRWSDSVYRKISNALDDAEVETKEQKDNPVRAADPAFDDTLIPRDGGLKMTPDPSSKNPNVGSGLGFPIRLPNGDVGRTNDPDDPRIIIPREFPSGRGGMQTSDGSEPPYRPPSGVPPLFPPRRDDSQSTRDKDPPFDPSRTNTEQKYPDNPEFKGIKEKRIPIPITRTITKNDKEPKDKDKDPKDSNSESKIVDTHKKQTGYGMLRPFFNDFHGIDILEQTDKQQLDEIGEYDLFDLPIDPNESMDNPVFVGRLMNEAFRFSGIARDPNYYKGRALATEIANNKNIGLVPTDNSFIDSNLLKRTGYLASNLFFDPYDISSRNLMSAAYRTNPNELQSEIQSIAQNPDFLHMLRFDKSMSNFSNTKSVVDSVRRNVWITETSFA